MPKTLMWVTIAFGAGIWWANLFHPALNVMYAAAAVLLGASLWQLRRGARYMAAIVAGLFFVAGVIRLEHAVAPSPWDVARHAGHTAELYGYVAGLPEWRESGAENMLIRYTIAVETVAVEASPPEAATGAVLLTLRQAKGQPVAAYGDRVAVYGRLLELHGYNNPGRIDGAAALKLQGITARMNAAPDAFRFEPSSTVSFTGTIAKVRERIIRDITQAMAPGDAALLNGILLGGYYGIKREVIKDFTATGLVHILSVSGAHIALVAGAVLWLGGRLRLKRQALAFTAAVAVAVYAVFAGLTPPVVRALVMGLIALAALGFGREKDSPQALALAALGMLAYQPELLYDVSFQLSFGATAGLVLFYRRTAERLAFLPVWMAGALAATVAAQLGALPFMAWYFNAVSLSSLLANIVIMPLVEIILITGLIAGVAGLVVPLLGKLLLVLCAQIIGLVVNITALLAALPGSSVYLPAMGIAAGLLYYLGLAWAYGYLPPSLPAPGAVVRQRPHVTAGAVALVAVIIAVQCWTPRPVQVHFIDVGQGDATLIITPYGRAVLVDTGGGDPAGFDIGERVVAPYLKHYGITAVDYLILTHGHADHAGGAAGVTGALAVKNIILPREEPGPAIQALNRATVGLPSSVAYTGQTIALDGVTVSLLHAGEIGGDATSGVVRVDYGRHSFLITGDLEARGEQALLARRLAPGSVLKVAHHGSRYSTTQEFLTVYSPDFAVISAGYNNRFGHPHNETLARLAERNIQIYRTDRHGAVVFRSNGDTLSVETFK